jgi:hypothetical protein
MTTALPAPVQSYIDACNAFDLEALTACFAADALVNDIRREFRGLASIRGFLEREIIGDRVTMEVSEGREHHGNFIVDAKMDGEYEKTGLPNPLILTHYFSVRGDRIVQLIIIHNEAVS